MPRLKQTLLLALGFLCGAAGAYAQGIAGDWIGALNLGGTELRLALHVTDAGGSLHATLDSLDQGANGIPVSSITLHGSALAFTVDAVHGSYRGDLSSDGSAITGTWMQGQVLPLTFKRRAATSAAAAVPSDLDGAWVGSLQAGGVKLRLVLHVANTSDGLTAKLDSPDQGANGLPVSTIVRNGNAVVFQMNGIGAKFEGTIEPDLSAIKGTWTQGGIGSPLEWRRAKSAAELERRRPQNPVRPYPYKEEEVAVLNKSAGVTLAGTLTLPQASGPFPAVLLITGSGPQDRDETILGHKPFLVIADYLTRRGIAVLRTDDRGFGKSTGNFASATTADFATDAQAGISFLKSRPDIDGGRIGLLGHSEGGIIAPMLAARDPGVAFIVMMAGPGVPGAELLVRQTSLLSTASGLPVAVAEKNVARERSILALLRQNLDRQTLKRKILDLMPELSDAQVGQQIDQITSPWFLYFIAYDPAPALKQVKCPVLAINGEKDVQVDPKQNLPAIRAALQAGGNRDFEVDEIKGLNHLFQTAQTGAPTEYGDIEETIAPLALEKIGGWISARIGPATKS